MRLPELKELAQGLGIKVDPKARKADLIAAIREVRGPATRGRPPKSKDAGGEYNESDARSPQESESSNKSASYKKSAKVEKSANTEQGSLDIELPSRKRERPARKQRGQAEESGDVEATQSPDRAGHRPSSPDEIVLPDRSDEAPRRQRGDRQSRGERQGRPNRENTRGPRNERERNDNVSAEDRRAALDAIGEAAERRSVESGDDEGNGRRNRRNRRERGRNGRDNQRDNQRDGQRDNQRDNQNRNPRQRDNQRDDAPEALEDDVLIPVAGILDVEGNQAFLRTGGYLPGSNDAAVSPQIVKQYGLRRGDAIMGAVRQRSERENVQNNRGRGPHRKFGPKLNPLVQVDSINSLDPQRSMERPEFGKLIPLYPQEMLRMETSSKALTARAIDLVAPIGKGQRGLVVSPPKAGKTMVMQQIAMAIAANNPQVHLMVVLVDERPEEVTDMKRLVKGEVIASTFDRPASDHTIVAELAIERAKRLVELGQDVVVLLDSITRLSRAYNLAAPASGRILSGGVDAGALYPPKKFFGAARNIENGGSLTIIASALVETGSKMDEVIFEEFKGTGNMELRLSRQLADRRIFPAIDVNASGTRREELLFSQEELKIIWQLRRALGTKDVNDASDYLLGSLRKTENNAEFLVSVLRSMQASGQ
ncbi:MAG: transcription termination factor Rho [Ancrocorticia sp.]